MNLREERKLWKAGFKRVACLDEAGRGPLAGPVVAAAAMINKEYLDNEVMKKWENVGVKDSKKLTSKKREEIYEMLIHSDLIEWGRGKVGNKVIDRKNIWEATQLAMKRAVKNLERKIKAKIDFLIIDGPWEIKSKISQKPIVFADQKIFSCQIASIVSKVSRDRTMERYHRKYPQYGFNKHKGYPTKEHLRMLKKYGPCKIHRKTFRPLKR